MKTEIFKTYANFLSRANPETNGVSPDPAAAHSSYAEERANSACWNCSRCSDCSGCSLTKIGSPAFVIPKIENIHQKILGEVDRPGALKMESWHTRNTTHCRGGWVIEIAGNAGKELEEKTSPLFAAMMIYKASSPIKVSPPRFYESNEVAMQDIRRCAAEESAASKNAEAK